MVTYAGNSCQPQFQATSRSKTGGLPISYAQVCNGDWVRIRYEVKLTLIHVHYHVPLHHRIGAPPLTFWSEDGFQWCGIKTPTCVIFTCVHMVGKWKWSTLSQLSQCTLKNPVESRHWRWRHPHQLLSLVPSSSYCYQHIHIIKYISGWGSRKRHASMGHP